MVLPGRDATEITTVPSRPFPRNRPELEIEGFVLPPEAFEDEIYLVPEYAAELLPGDTIIVNGERMLSPERTLLDLATCTTGADLWRMLDAALSGRLVTTQGLRHAADRHRTHEGSERLIKFLNAWSE